MSYIIGDWRCVGWSLCVRICVERDVFLRGWDDRLSIQSNVYRSLVIRVIRNDLELVSSWFSPIGAPKLTRLRLCQPTFLKDCTAHSTPRSKEQMDYHCNECFYCYCASVDELFIRSNAVWETVAS